MIFISFATICHCVLVLLKRDGAKQLVAEMLVLRAQLLVVKRKAKRPLQLTPSSRLVLGLASLFIRVRRLERVAVVVSPATILKFHRFLVKRKYSMLFKNKGKGGRPPISASIRKLVVDLKTANPMFGCPQIASILKDRTGISIDEETVRRILLKYYRPPPAGNGPSWLSFLGSQADSLWSCDLFRVESALLQSYWILVVMDQYSRKIMGFAVTKGPVAGQDLCRMFNSVASDLTTPKRLSHDNDPLFRFEQWIRNMDIMGIEEIRSVPYTPTSHPFCERLIGTVRREFTDRTIFGTSWTSNASLPATRNILTTTGYTRGLLEPALRLCTKTWNQSTDHLTS